MLDGGWWEEVVMVEVRGVNEKSKVDDAFLPIWEGNPFRGLVVF